MVKKKISATTRKPNPWMVHLAKTRKENPTVKNVVKLSQIAKKTYKKK